jgi:hypothetical protein
MLYIIRTMGVRGKFIIRIGMPESYNQYGKHTFYFSEGDYVSFGNTVTLEIQSFLSVVQSLDWKSN